MEAAVTVSTLPTVDNMLRLISGADNQDNSKGQTNWAGVQSIDSVTVLTDQLQAGLGFGGTGEAIYRVTMVGRKYRLVLEQVSSYDEGYSVFYTWADDECRQR